MRARIPQDVDLEDRLVLGLTPVRFGYLVIGGLAAFCVWSGRWGAIPARLTLALPLLVGGVALAWGRWRGRPLDRWAADLAMFLRGNVRVARHGDDRRPEASAPDPSTADPPPVPAVRTPAQVPALPAPSHIVHAATEAGDPAPPAPGDPRLLRGRQQA